MRNAPLIGKRVKIHAIKQQGSVRLLDGLTGTLVGPHAIASDWVTVRLDPNPVTPHQEWSIPEDRLVPCETDEIKFHAQFSRILKSCS